jgi:hypothetical protein
MDMGNAAPSTALCRSKVVFSGTANFAHEGTSIPKFPGLVENSVLAATSMELAVQFCVHCVKLGKVLFPVVKQHALHILKNILLLVERNIFSRYYLMDWDRTSYQVHSEGTGDESEESRYKP